MRPSPSRENPSQILRDAGITPTTDAVKAFKLGYAIGYVDGKKRSPNQWPNVETKRSPRQD